MKRATTIIAIGLTATMLLSLGCATDEQTSTSTQPDDAQSIDAPRAEMRGVMYEKLAYARDLFNSICLQDFQQIEATADALTDVSRQSEWIAHTTVTYDAFSQRFRDHTNEIAAAARERNLDGITAGYLQMTQTCIDCHSYMRREGLITDRPGRVSDAEELRNLINLDGWVLRRADLRPAMFAQRGP